MNSRVPYPFCAFCRKGGLFRSKSTDSLLFHSFTLSLLSVLPTSPPHTHIPTKKHCDPDRSGPVPFPRAFLRAPGHAAEGSLFDPRALSPPKKSCHPERSEGSALSFLATRHSPPATHHFLRLPIYPAFISSVTSSLRSTVTLASPLEAFHVKKNRSRSSLLRSTSPDHSGFFAIFRLPSRQKSSTRRLRRLGLSRS